MSRNVGDAMTTSSGMPEEPRGVVRVTARAPFDLGLTVGALRRLPQSALYPFVDGELRVVAALPSGHHLLSVRVVGADAGASIIQVEALDAPFTDGDAGSAAALVARMLGVERDLAPVRALVAEDAALGPLVERLAGLRPPRFPTLWETFCQIVPFQQVSLSAAVATLNRFVMALGPEFVVDGASYWGVPTPERVAAADTEALRACGLSAAKARTLRGLAERALAGELAADALEGLSDEDAIMRLTRLPGIGRWSAQVALLRGLGRLSVFPSGDSGAARGLRELFPLHPQPEAAAAALLDQLGPWRGYLYFLLLGRRLLATNVEAH